MDPACQPVRETASRNVQWSREDSTANVTEFEKAVDELGLSQREFAIRAGVPRTTLQGWVERKKTIDAPSALVAFLESPEGLVFLHRIVLAAQLVITLLAPGGIRLVGTFLRLCGLDRFVASSYGSQQQQIMALEGELGVFSGDQRSRLGATMRQKRITVCEDETFHPQTCLVATEPASGFILAEQYAESRDAETWTAVMAEATAGLPVEIIQSVSDQAQALIKHTEQNLDAHHSPDTFHVQQEVVKGTSFPMSTSVRNERKKLDAAKGHVAAMEQSRDIYESKSDDDRGCCTPSFVEKAVAKALEDEVLARENLDHAKEQQEEMRAANRGISQAYHPFDLDSGTVRSAEQVGQDIEAHFATIDGLADAVSLSQRCLDRIDKARRVVVRMIATIAFFHATVRERVEALGLPEKIEKVIYERWLPGLYIQLAAARATKAERRAQLRAAAAALLPSPQEIEALLSPLGDQDRALIGLVVEDCAQLFQRSSSCVEGRNGHLSLFHHGQHRLSQRKLSALTTVHNYFKQRPDGTTAAERFFEQKHEDLFEWLLRRTPLPPRPASSRSLLAN